MPATAVTPSAWKTCALTTCGVVLHIPPLGLLGSRSRIVVFHASLTPAFWGRCDGVANDWELHGFLSCAKGEPLQLMRVGHGAAHARFRDVPIEVRD